MTNLLKRVLYASLVLGVAAGFAIAGAPASNAQEREPVEVTVYGSPEAPEDKVIPGPDPIEGVAEGVYFAGKGVVNAGREVVSGIGESGGKVGEEVEVHGAPGIVSGTAKGVGRIGEGAVRGAGELGHGAIKGTGCILTFGAVC